MPILTLDYRNNPLPDIVKGIPVGRGYRMTLRFRGTAELLVSDSIWVYIKVPTDEHWYVKQWFVDDDTATGLPNGWQSQVMTASFPLQQSPVMPSGAPDNGPWSEDTNPLNWVMIWNRVGEPVGAANDYIFWEDRHVNWNAEDGMLIVRCTDPVWSECRWGPGTEVRIKSLGCESAAAAPYAFEVEMNVIRYRVEDADFNQLVLVDGREKVIDTDVHMVQHYVALGE